MFQDSIYGTQVTFQIFDHVIIAKPRRVSLTISAHLSCYMHPISRDLKSRLETISVLEIWKQETIIIAIVKSRLLSIMHTHAFLSFIIVHGFIDTFPMKNSCTEKMWNLIRTNISKITISLIRIMILIVSSIRECGESIYLFDYRGVKLTRDPDSGH